MKKLALLTAAAFAALGAQAQSARPNQSATLQKLSDTHTTVVPSGARQGVPAWHSNAKSTAAVPFVVDTFSANSIGTGPTQWVATGNTGSDTWAIRTTGTNFLSGLLSTTRAGGYLSYDAFTAGANHPGTNPQYGYVTSPAYSCTGHNYVGVQFQSYHRHLADTTFVDVSTNNFTSFTRFPVAVNNNLGGNQETENPTIVRINITSAAANNPSVKIRFTYAGGYAGTGTSGSGGTYGWSIDDFALVDLDQIDLGVGRSAVVMPLHNAFGFTTFSALPVNFADSLFPVTFVSNYGGTSPLNDTVTASIATTSGAPLVNSIILSGTPLNTTDSEIDFTTFSGYRPTAAQGLVTSFSLNKTGDGLTANNRDTVYQNITDSVWTSYKNLNAAGTPDLLGGYYLQRRAAGAGTPAVAFYNGTLFEVGKGKSDTLTSIEVAYENGTDTGVLVRAEIYYQDTAATRASSFVVWRLRYLTNIDTITAAKVPTTFGNIVWTKFRPNIGSGTLKTYPIFNEGDWAVVFTTIKADASKQVLVYRATGPSTVAGQFGVSDTSTNVGSLFGSQTKQSRLSALPVMRLNFSNDARRILLGVNDVTAVKIGNAYPNPANTVLNIPVSTVKGAEVTVSLSNMMGQTLQVRNIGALAAGASTTVRFNTSDIAPGMYFYTVEANGQRQTNRVVVTH